MRGEEDSCMEEEKPVGVENQWSKVSIEEEEDQLKPVEDPWYED